MFSLSVFITAKWMLSLLLFSIAVLRREEIEIEASVVVALAVKKADFPECSAALTTSMKIL